MDTLNQTSMNREFNIGQLSNVCERMVRIIGL